ncbi:MAG: YbaB/EbfC family nucleoid-associated protein [Bacillota bacterium]|nr:YbaB/EbfC family nucleoid-associated protein [Bacillota bacterium]
MGFNMQKLMKQMQKMQNDVAQVQEQLQTLTVEGSAGGGMVKVIATAAQDIVSIEIDPQIIDPDDKEMLEDLITAAVKDALAAAKAASAEQMSAVTGGINIPGL